MVESDRSQTTERGRNDICRSDDKARIQTHSHNTCYFQQHIKEILGLIEKSDIIDITERKRLQWYGHIKRMQEERISYEIMWSNVLYVPVTLHMFCLNMLTQYTDKHQYFLAMHCDIFDAVSTTREGCKF
jgi:hypothetical protein